MLPKRIELPAIMSENGLSEIAARLRFAACALAFACVVAVLFTASTFVRATRIHFLMRWAGRVVTAVAQIRLTVRGLENLPPGGCLLVCNHVNMFDPMILYAVVPRHIVAIEKAAHFAWPLYGAVIRRWGNLPVASRHAAESRESLARAARLMRAGTPVFIFPEGTRARNGRLGSFKKGGFALAIEAGVPLIPVVFKGADRIFREGSYRVFPGDEEVAFLPAFPLDGYGPDDVVRLADDVRSRIEAELVG